MTDENSNQVSRGSKGESGGKRKRQTVLDSLLNNLPSAPPQVEQVVGKVEMANALTPTQLQELEAARETYLAKWAESCDAQHQKHLTRGKQQPQSTPDETDLDAKALHFVNAFVHIMKIALACDAAIPTEFVECLVLVVRNDRLHRRVHASQLAHDALLKYVQAKGYTKLCNVEKDDSSPPMLLINNMAAWVPLSEYVSTRLTIQILSQATTGNEHHLLFFI